MKKVIEILHALCLALAAWLRGRRRREANDARRAVAEHDAEAMNRILQGRRDDQ